jgi:hypothetical protein
MANILKTMQKISPIFAAPWVENNILNFKKNEGKGKNENFASLWLGPDILINKKNHKMVICVKTLW